MIRLRVVLAAAVIAALGVASAFVASAAVPTANVVAVDVDPGTPGVQAVVSVPVGANFRIDTVIVSVADPWIAEQVSVQFDPKTVKYVGGPAPTNLGGAFLCGDSTNPDSVYGGCARQSGTAVSDAGVTRTWTFECVAEGNSRFHLQSSDEVTVAVGTNFALADSQVADPVLRDASVSCGGSEPTPAPATAIPTQPAEPGATAPTDATPGPTLSPATASAATAAAADTAAAGPNGGTPGSAQSPGAAATSAPAARAAATSTAAAVKTSTAQGGDQSSSDSGMPAWLIAVIVIVVVGAAGGAGWLVISRRGTGSSG